MFARGKAQANTAGNARNMLRPFHQPGSWRPEHFWYAHKYQADSDAANVCDGFQPCKLSDSTRRTNLDLGDAPFL